VNRTADGARIVRRMTSGVNMAMGLTTGINLVQNRSDRLSTIHRNNAGTMMNNGRTIRRSHRLMALVRFIV